MTEREPYGSPSLSAGLSPVYRTVNSLLHPLLWDDFNYFPPLKPIYPLCEDIL